MFRQCCSLILPKQKIQWTWPDAYGERQYVVMMGGGGLHIEMAMLAVIGDWLEGSGWTNVMKGSHTCAERFTHMYRSVPPPPILQQRLCLIFSTGHIQNTVQTHQMMNNTSLSGVRIWRQITG